MLLLDIFAVLQSMALKFKVWTCSLSTLYQLVKFWCFLAEHPIHQYWQIWTSLDCAAVVLTPLDCASPCTVHLALKHYALCTVLKYWWVAVSSCAANLCCLSRWDQLLSLHCSTVQLQCCSSILVELTTLNTIPMRSTALSSLLDMLQCTVSLS